jgi:hypothetical protein
VGFPVCYGSQKHHECKEGERSGRWCRVTLHVQTCSDRNRIIPLMRWTYTDSAPYMLVTIPRNQLLIRYVVTSSVHTVTIWCCGTVLKLYMKVVGTDQMWHRKWVLKLYVKVVGTYRMWHGKWVLKLDVKVLGTDRL